MLLLWSSQLDSHQRHLDFQSSALLAELQDDNIFLLASRTGFEPVYNDLEGRCISIMLPRYKVDGIPARART